MAFEIKNPPEFTLDVEQWTRETEADGAQMASGVIEKLLNNEVYNKASVERLREVTLVSLPAAGWTGGAAPFVQTVAVSGATETSEAVLVSALAEGASLAEQRAYVKAYGIVCSGTARLGAGTATFRVYKRPATDLVVGLRGVMG